MFKVLRITLGLVILVGVIAASWNFAKADVTSCSASVAQHTVNPSTTVDFTIQINNTDIVPITWVRITRPSSDFTIIANSSPGWQSTTSSRYAFQTNGTLSPGQSMTVTITAIVGSNDAASANWTVQTSEQPGINVFSCSGSLGTAISGAILDTTPPVISSVSVSSVTKDSAVVSWTTDEPSTSQVNYGTSSGYGQSTSLDSTLTTSHSVSLTGLSSNTGYHFQARSIDDSSNTGISSDNTFLTASNSSGGGSSSGSGGGSESSGGSQGTDNNSVLSTKIPLKEEPTENIPPEVKLTTDFRKPFAKTPLITGEVTDNEIIAGIEYSIDGGSNWLAVDTDEGVGTDKAIFSFTPLNLDDGNFDVLVRAIDTSGNIGVSDGGVLVIDRLPPIAGGAVLTLGPQILNPDEKGVVYYVAGIDQKITVSAVGGPTSMKAVAKPVGSEQSQETFNLTKMPDTGLWSGVISFKNAGSYNLVIEAIDGAGNKTSRTINDIYVAPQPQVVSKNNEEPIAADIEVFYLEPESNRWTLWEGDSYGQANPQTADPLGSFKLFLPEGKYYITATAKGYSRLTTDIFEINQSKPVSTILQMEKRVGFSIGRIDVVLPTWTTSVVNTNFNGDVKNDFGENKIIGAPLPEFSLKNTKNQEVNPISLLGKSTLVTVMNTWSPDSSRQAEALSKLQENKDINVIPVALQESAGKVNSFTAIGGHDLIWVVDPDSKLGSLLGPNGVPAHYLIDRRGYVKDIVYGYVEAKDLEAKLGSLF